MYICKTNSNLFLLAEKMEWANVEVLNLDPAITEAIEDVIEDFNELQKYLEALYLPLRANGGTDVSGVEAPAWLLDQVSKQESTSTSPSEASSSSTSEKATSSGSPSDEEDGSA